MSNIVASLVAIQSALKAPKDQKANRYRYRNIEDINEAVKPLAASQGCAVVYADTYEDGVCVSTCKLINEAGEEVSASAFAAINETPQHMSIEQSCGAASSYARKYAACGLFAIDDSQNDPDATQDARQPRKAPEKKAPAKAPSLLEQAKRELMDACKAYAAAHGSNAEKIAAGVRARPDYEANKENRDWFLAVANELREEL